MGAIAGKVWTVAVERLQEKIKALEARLAASELRYQQLLEAMNHVPTGVEIYDEAGLAEYLNPAMLRMIALPSADEVLGKFNILTDPFSEETGMKILYERAYAGEVVHTEEFMVEMERAAEDWGTGARSVWFRMVLVPIKDAAGRVEKVFAIMFETTQQRQMKALLQLVSRRDGLEILAGGVAHDYNNLLTAIVMSAGLVEECIGERETVAQLAQEILLAGRQARFLTGQLQAYAGENWRAVTNSDVARLARETARMLESTVGVEHRFTVSSPASALLSLVNEGQFKQVVMNLITNARDALPRNGGEISVRSQRLDLDRGALDEIFFADPAKPGVWHCIEVTDNGCGMPPATMERMFEPYFTTKETGHGLGLAAVMGIIRGYGGGIRVQSEVGQGTTIGVYLRPSDEVAPVEAIRSVKSIPKFDRVVIADDSSFVRASLRQVFLRLEVDVLEATNGAEALDLVLSAKNRPDLLVMDLMMPVLNGLDALEAIRARDPALPVVLMSAHTETGTKAAGGDPSTSFIAKPFELDALLAVVAAALAD